MKARREMSRDAGRGMPAPGSIGPDSLLDGQMRAADGSPPPRPAEEQRDRIVALSRDRAVHGETPSWAWPRSSEP